MSIFFKIFFVTVLFITILRANIQNFKFEHLNSQNGLSSVNVNAIYQDRYGFLWFGTEGGLNRYDGYNIKEYIHDVNDINSLAQNFVVAIEEDSEGYLWIATGYRGIHNFNPDDLTFKRFQHDINNENSLGGDKVNCLSIDDSNDVWIGSRHGGGLSRLKISTDTNDKTIYNFQRYYHDSQDNSSLSDNSVLALLNDEKNRLWIGTENGINLLEKKTQTFRRFIFNQYPTVNVSAIFEDNYNNIWIGTTERGVYRFNEQSDQFESILPEISGHISSIIQDNRGNIWIGLLNNGGLYIYNPTSEALTHLVHEKDNPYSLCCSTINCMFVDNSGIIWIGTNSQGLSKFDWKKQRFLHLYKNPHSKFSLSDNSVFSIFEEYPHKIWVGTEHEGIDVFYIDKGEKANYKIYKTESQLAEQQLSQSIIKDSKGNIWVGTTSGLAIYNHSKNKILLYENYLKNAENKDYISLPVRTLFEDKQGLLWIGTDGYGLVIFNVELEQIKYYPKITDQKNMGGKWVHRIFEDADSQIWVCSGGLNRYDRDHEKFVYYQADSRYPDSVYIDYVGHIAEDDQGNFWMTRVSKGLIKFNKHSGYYTFYSIDDGLPSNDLYSILDDSKGNLWIATGKGISKYNIKNNIFTNYDVQDGLQGNEFTSGSYHRGASGRLYFGGPGGLNIFYPDSINLNSHIPKPVISDLKLFNKSVNPNSNSILRQAIYKTRELELTHRDYIISFEFCALEYSIPKKNQYAYKLEGFDKNWIYTDFRNRTATYTNLDPEKYLFKVKGSNNDGVWNEEVASLALIISPPWWQTNFAYFAYFIIFILLVYSIREYEIRRLRLKHQYQLRNQQAEHYEKMNTEKSRFFAGISHEFRTPLTLILGPIERLIRQIKNEKQVKDLQHIKDNAQRMNKLVDMYLDLSMLESGTLSIQKKEKEIICITENVLASFESMAADKKINLRFKSNLNSAICNIEKEKFEQIIINLVNNAIKFTPSEGYIDIGIEPERSGKKVILTVSDTGIGIDKNQLDKIFDMFYQVDNDENKRLSGTGIGLAMVKELVRLHDGEISVNSQLGRGTEFKIELPVVQINDDVSKKDADKIVREFDFESEDDIETDDGIRILIVEDNREMRDYIQSLLDDQYKTETSRDGIEGIEKAITFLPDLIISDVMMPNMDGYEFVDKIKNDLRTSHMPVILLTAKTNQPDKLKGLKTGADAYITKPFDPDELSVCIDSLLENRERIQKKFIQDKYFNPSDLDVTSADEKFLQKCHQVVETNLSNPEFSMKKFANEVHLSRTQLYKKLKSLTGLSATEYVKTLRLKKAAILLESGFGNIAEIAYETGFSNPSYFAESFRKLYHISPSQYTEKSKS